MAEQVNLEKLPDPGPKKAKNFAFFFNWLIGICYFVALFYLTFCSPKYYRYWLLPGIIIGLIPLIVSIYYFHEKYYVPYRQDPNTTILRRSKFSAFVLEWFFPILIIHGFIIVSFLITLHGFGIVKEPPEEENGAKYTREYTQRLKGSVFTHPFMYGLIFKRIENQFGLTQVNKEPYKPFDLESAKSFEGYFGAWEKGERKLKQSGEPEKINEQQEYANDVEVYLHKIPFLIAFAFGFLGTLIYTLKDIAYRFYTDDLYSKTFVSYVIRFIFAPCICMIIAYCIADNWWVSAAPLVFFMVGYFPDRGLQFIEVQAMKKLNLEKKDVEKDIPPLGLIQGISEYNIYRFKEIGINNSQNLAWEDLSKLRANIGLDAPVLCDFVSQALLLVHLKDDFAKLQGAGIRNIIAFKERVSSDEEATNIANSLKITPENILTVKRVLESDYLLKRRIKEIEDCIKGCYPTEES